MKFISYQVRRPSGKPKGELTFSYKFGEKVTVPKPAKKSELVMAYPVGATKSTGYPTVQQKPAKKKSSGMGFHRSFHLLSPHIHRSFHDLSLRFGPIFTLRLGSVPCIVVTSPELAKEFLKTLMLSFINRSETTAVEKMTYNASFAFAPYGNYWKFTDPVFDPRKSSFSSLPCSSPLCRHLDSPGCSSNSKTCLYQVSYGDGSFTFDDFSTETLTFRRSKIPEVALGCGHDNEGLFVGAVGEAC
ncbi:hypothetical protein ACLB2K_034524 [Fragaria x ananassa]